MRTHRMLALGALASSLAIGSIASPSAQATELKREGKWVASADVVNGKPRCAIINDDAMQYLQVHYLRGDDHLSLQIGSEGWNLPSGKTYDYIMQIDQEDIWAAQATPGHYTDGSHYIGVDIRADQTAKWVGEFAHGQYLVVSFPRSRARPWVLDLTGTRSVAQAFATCLDFVLNMRVSSTR